MFCLLWNRHWWMHPQKTTFTPAEKKALLLQHVDHIQVYAPSRTLFRKVILTSQGKYLLPAIILAAADKVSPDAYSLAAGQASHQCVATRTFKKTNSCTCHCAQPVFSRYVTGPRRGQSQHIVRATPKHWPAIRATENRSRYS